HRTRKLRILAVTSLKRLAAAPDIPTAAEEGISGLVAPGFSALFAPKGTPSAIIEHIARATGQAMADLSLQQALIASGVEPVVESRPQQTRQFIEAEIAKWRPVVAAAGLKL